MNKFFDLRFVIGCFFLIVGILLLLYGFFTNSVNDQTVNRWCGGIFCVFGITMILLSYQKKATDETPN